MLVNDCRKAIAAISILWNGIGKGLLDRSNVVPMWVHRDGIIVACLDGLPKCLLEKDEEISRHPTTTQVA